MNSGNILDLYSLTTSLPIRCTDFTKDSHLREQAPDTPGTPTFMTQLAVDNPYLIAKYIEKLSLRQLTALTFRICHQILL